ncbi:MAG TPA: hypothetical protein VG845_00080 [Dehalococcoidia bacterium]|nr:hypothetical protein [Dehalococcoidia bacterium]
MDPTQVAEALKTLAGTPRVLVYDVAEAGAPSRDKPQTPFVRGSDAWWAFVARRRALDDGQDLNLLISLRGLRVDERMLVVNWGTAFANSFLVIEPSDPWLDLTTQQGIDEFAAQTGASDADGLVRAAYAEWIYWVRDESGELESRTARLSIEAGSTLQGTLADRLPRTFPASAFLSSLTLLQLKEAELFTGGREVARAIMPFLTRLGLPIVYDGRHVIQGVRQLVNAGLAWVQDPQDNWRLYTGPGEPIPAEISDERVSLMMR